ncbi:MAG: DUF4160 domain-containing protein [Acidobacteria bacterium]|nr:DUF4160 domain-containing protein [Acidobacteriota bacterium]
MPTILTHGSYRAFFYSGDGGEPGPIHVERDNKIAKIWLDPIKLESSEGSGRIEINQILRITERNQRRLVEAWNEYSGA